MLDPAVGPMQSWVAVVAVRLRSPRSVNWLETPMPTPMPTLLLVLVPRLKLELGLMVEAVGVMVACWGP